MAACLKKKQIFRTPKKRNQGLFIVHLIYGMYYLSCALIAIFAIKLRAVDTIQVAYEVECIANYMLC
jgi:hypothetical protein